MDPLVANLFLSVMRIFMLSLSGSNQAHVNEVFNSTLRYQDDLLNIDNHFCKNSKSDISHRALVR